MNGDKFRSISHDRSTGPTGIIVAMIVACWRVHVVSTSRISESL